MTTSFKKEQFSLYLHFWNCPTMHFLLYFITMYSLSVGYVRIYIHFLSIYIYRYQETFIVLSTTLLVFILLRPARDFFFGIHSIYDK